MKVEPTFVFLSNGRCLPLYILEMRAHWGRSVQKGRGPSMVTYLKLEIG
jgi:hypothetical protein